MNKNRLKITEEEIIARIFFIRGKRVMLDSNLAELYQVKTSRINEQVKRNIKRFPQDFMFQLTEKEFINLKSHFATSSWGGIRKLPFVFTENGVAMLSSVLNSDRAIQVNIQIMRTFTKFKEVLARHKNLEKKIAILERKYDQQFKIVFDAIKQMIIQEEKPKQIGFLKGEK